MRKRNLVLLAVCQGLMMSSTSLNIASSALVGVVLAPSPALTTLPLGLLFLTIMVTMIPASLFMKRYGRCAGFLLGGFMGIVGGGVAATAIYQDSFVFFCIGSAVFGVSSSFGQYYRFAAAELASDQYRSRAISWVLAGGVVAAFIGPNTARLTRDLIPDALFSASYGAIVVFCGVVILLQVMIRYAAPSSDEVSGERRPLGFVISRPTFLVAAICAMIAYGIMNLLMTVTPLAMEHRGVGFDHTAQVIQWHIVGMFAPSFFTGSLIHRFGVLKVMFVGVLLLFAVVIVALSGQALNQFYLGLILLGLGWNFLYVGGTTLLTEVYLPAEKGAVQGVNEFLVFSATAFTAITSGYFHHVFGWESLNLYVVPVIAFAGGIILLLGMTVRKQQTRTA